MSLRLMNEVGVLTARVSVLEEALKEALKNKTTVPVVSNGLLEDVAIQHRVRQCENEIRMLKARMAKKNNNEGT